ncbi:MAG: cache domain-containing protein [Bacteroidales bacterium]|nr:cache domain-containing protein [Bacteroidales bacterium]
MRQLIKTRFFQRIVLPAMLAILMFVISVFAFIIPAFERNAVSQKKNMLLELTNTGWSILDKYHHDEKSGLLTLEEAQKKAIVEIEALRYGPDKKDYFWITDLTPVMIMHPYVQDLTGKNLKNFTDPDGTRIFMEALDIVEKQGEGFMRYKWQFKDDPEHIDPKLSFVKKFAPWNWIIGTGMYLYDVQAEISRLTNRLILILLGITLIITLIIFFITYQSLTIEKSRLEAEEQLHESKEKYKSLIESSTEGIILLMNSKISYANSFIQNWLQYSGEELQNIEVNSLFVSDIAINIAHIHQEKRLETDLKKKDGSVTNAVLTILPVRFAEKEGVLLTFRDTSEQRSARLELEDIKKRYQDVSKYSNLGLFRLSLKQKKQLVEFNHNVLSILGYTSKSELKKTPFTQILSGKSELKKILRELKEKQIVVNRHISLKKKDSSAVEVRLNLNLSVNLNDEYLFCDGIIEPLGNGLVPEEFNYSSFDIATLFSLNNQPVMEYSSPVISCPGDATILVAMEVMLQNNSSCVLLMLYQKCIGIITQKDIVNRFIYSKMAFNSLASEFMSAPVVYIEENTTVEVAASIFEKKKISHLVIRNLTGEPVGIIDKNKLFGVYINPVEAITETIGNSANIQELTNIRERLPGLIRPLLNETGSALTLSKMISKFNDGITEKIIKNAIRELGQPPVPFAFVSIGSAGREELVFNSDQDNAVIFEDKNTIPAETLQQYFLALSEKICTNLDETGLPLCKGGYMANNPKWCQPLGVWKEYFSDWIINAEPENILNISVFFDLRLVYGDNNLFKKLEDFVFDSLKGRTAFFYFLAQSVIGFKPPINVFGNIVTETSRKNVEIVDVKSCLAPVVMFARIYALYNNIRYNGTIDRINALGSLNILSQSTCDEVKFHFNYLMQQRMKQQITQIRNKTEISNEIIPKKMTEMEQLILKKVFSQMNGYQEKLSAEFMSAYKG